MPFSDCLRGPPPCRPAGEIRQGIQSDLIHLVPAKQRQLQRRRRLVRLTTFQIQQSAASFLAFFKFQS